MRNEDMTEIPDDLKDLFDACPPADEVVRELEANKKDWEREPVFVSEYLKAEFMNGVWEALERQGLSQSELAERVGWSRQYASRMLKSQMNLTIDTMAKLACALGLRLEIKLHRPDEHLEMVRVPRRGTKNVVHFPETPCGVEGDAAAKERSAAYGRVSGEGCEHPEKRSQRKRATEIRQPAREPRKGGQR